MSKETLFYHNYEIVEKTQSKIDPNAIIETTVGFHCPRCKRVLKPLDHGDSTRCPGCGLEMTLHGNALHCEG